MQKVGGEDFPDEPLIFVSNCFHRMVPKLTTNTLPIALDCLGKLQLSAKVSRRRLRALINLILLIYLTKVLLMIPSGFVKVTTSIALKCSHTVRLCLPQYVDEKFNQ